MSSISAKDLALNYPLYGQGGAAARRVEAGDESRLLRNSAGDVIGVRALQSISFDIKSGERVALLGANGSGKTSLLQVLAGIYTPDQGRVDINGRATALVNINLGMSDEASGHKNITLRGLAAGWSRKEIEEKRAEIAEFSELGEFLDLPVQTYSSGMRMRLSFAIVTSFEPEILILDEWLSAGDAAFREKATKRMQRLVERAGILVLASHSPALLRATCSRAIWLDQGRILADGDIEEVLPMYGREMLARRDRAEANANQMVTTDPKSPG